MVTGLARIMEITTNLGISSHNLGTIEKCFIELYMKCDYFARLTGKYVL